ncbi:MAG: glycosyltransferase [Simkaniaceae bacterium]|nr:glycosyltransferase [Candidatus Sacchlamyda saccharinae]
MYKSLLLFLFIASFSFASEDKKLAIAIAGYNRPDYLDETLEALARNPESMTTPIFFFFDGGRDAKQNENLAVAKRYNFPFATYILRDKNFGCGKNLIDARRQIFDKHKYEKALILEDDNKISSNYIQLMLELLDWAKKDIGNVGLVSGWSNVPLNFEEKDFFLNKVVRNAHGNYWAYLMDADCWNAIKDVYYEYERSFLYAGGKSHYDHQHAIRKWIRHRVEKYHPTQDSYAEWFLNPNYPVGQDGILRLSLWEANLNYTATIVNRMVNIGKIGLNYNEEVWQRNLGMYELDEFEEDVHLDSFEIWVGKIR